MTGHGCDTLLTSKSQLESFGLVRAGKISGPFLEAPAPGTCEASLIILGAVEKTGSGYAQAQASQTLNLSVGKLGVGAHEGCSLHVYVSQYNSTFV